MTSFLEYIRSSIETPITPDEDTRVECRNVGSSMQFDWALYSFKHSHSNKRNNIIQSIFSLC